MIEKILRPCCGYRAALARFYEGSVPFPHHFTCRFYQLKRK